MEDYVEVQMQEQSESWNDKECSMCGDVGFHTELFKCTSCLYRFQHTYCSFSYPNMDLDQRICDWCKKSEKKHGIEKAVTNSNRKHKSFRAPLDRNDDVLAHLLDVPESPYKTEKVSEAGKLLDQQADLKKDLLSNEKPLYYTRQREENNEKKNPGSENCRRKSKSAIQVPGSSTKAIGRRYKLLADVLS